MCNSNQEALMEELEIENRRLKYRVAQLERAQKYYPGFPAPGPGQKDIHE